MRLFRSQHSVQVCIAKVWIGGMLVMPRHTGQGFSVKHYVSALRITRTAECRSSAEFPYYVFLCISGEQTESVLYLSHELHGSLRF